MNFSEFNEKNAKKFSKRVTIAGISISIPIALLLLGMIVFVVLFLHEFYNLMNLTTTFEISKILKNQYKKDFNVVEEVNIIDDKGNGLYMMSPADNSNIVFYAYKTGSTATIDYEQYLIKDYVTEYVKNNSEIYCFDTNFLLFDTNFFLSLIHI